MHLVLMKSFSSFIPKDSESYAHTASMPSPKLCFGLQWGKGKRQAMTLASDASSSPSFFSSCSICKGTKPHKTPSDGGEDMVFSTRICTRITNWVYKTLAFQCLTENIQELPIHFEVRQGRTYCGTCMSNNVWNYKIKWGLNVRRLRQNLRITLEDFSGLVEGCKN